ncbi:MAG: cupredoxin domain-containing protein [Acidimicrobiales bacterium]
MNRIAKLMMTAGISGALAVGASACGGGSSAQAGSSTAPSGATASGPDTVIIKNFEFMPKSLTVKAGATVSVHTEDSTTHTLTAINGAFNTGDIAPGTTKTFTAPAHAGQYSFDCQIHQYMTGTLTVTG